MAPSIHSNGINQWSWHLRTTALILVLGFLSLATADSVIIDTPTTIHKPGMCAMYGQCGAESTFGIPLACPANVKAVLNMDDHFQSLVAKTCGESYRNQPLCCDANQVQTQLDSMKIAYNLVSACPACWENFRRFFCDFTCSQNQSTFVNVTGTKVSPRTNKTIVAEVSLYVSPDFGTGFYDSCKDVKFPADNSFVMRLLGGGATNYLGFLQFMGKKQTGGSPFQINFPNVTTSLPSSMSTLNRVPVPCTDPEYKCSCVDCEKSCLVLPELPHPAHCKVGPFDCIPFGFMMAYGAVLISVIVGYYILNQRSKQKAMPKNTPLLASNEDEDANTTISVSQSTLVPDTLTAQLGPEFTMKESFINTSLQNWFFYQGRWCASNPWWTVSVCIVLVLTASTGWRYFDVETNPVRLWVGPTSETASQKTYFDENFGPFYRTQQLIFTSTDGESIITKSNIRKLFVIQDTIAQIKTDNASLEDLCFRPLDSCMIQSVTGYWQDDLRLFDGSNFESEFKRCTETPTSCLPKFGQPLKPDLIFGGFEDEKSSSSRALIVTYVMKNSLDERTIRIAEGWETSLIDYLKTLQRSDLGTMELSFSTEISIEKELNRETSANAVTIAISYCAMFIYASLTLGRWSNLSRAWIDSKFTLGMLGIMIVLASVSAAVGVFSYLGFKITLIIAEVVPFLVLAVGVDNIFILIHAFERTDPDLAVEDRAGIALGQVGPSVMLSSLSETIAFGLGAAVTMPAVRVFSMYAALAVFVDFLLQVTAFVALMALDAKRMESNRVDCFPCIRMPTPQTPQPTESFLQMLMAKYYSPFLLHPVTKLLVVLAFFGSFLIFLSAALRVELGLDQRIALPRDSYLINYFDNLESYFRVGPPVYFVARGVDVTTREGQQSVCGRFSGCAEYSLSNILEQERKRPEVSYLAEPTAVWLDDFLLWLNPVSELCCRLKPSSKTPNNPFQVCAPEDDEDECKVCWADKKWSTSMEGFPEGAEFMEYLNYFLVAEPSEYCPLSGAAAYQTALVLDPVHNKVNGSHFRTYHTVLKTQGDFINALKSAKRIAADISKRTGLDVFPYSIFYVFFEQYDDIVRLAITVVATAVVAVMIVTAILLSLWSALFVGVLCAVIVVDLVGIMGIWGISLNALSTVNLVIAVGISVEFLSHVMRAFMVSKGTRNERAFKALVEMGSSVFSGITLTKFVGVSVLAFAPSKIFVVYYFRMYLAIVLLGAAHGLAVLPVLLSWFGESTVMEQSSVFLDGVKGKGPARHGTHRSRTSTTRDMDDEERVLLMDSGDDRIDSPERQSYGAVSDL
ncbi:hypothetical protein SmJEL517_g05502 [Synchytrium microbalum]|uniref:SSD domain-containing protein n=1 Tax=Synchytrium microbalum TaxID=1806994 RepID=A0A507BV93_9FUNG|nr:uncharacterized protein SmJEL517_g05502 [Synchytrium microbalum]TPX31091.1 hypothetical protein SmJEL517_g05502 [Synchytrium microbalum]